MSETDTDLPKTLIKRIVKRHLSQIDKGDTKRDTQINKDALLAFSESAKVFINYVTATANDICKESKRQTISVDDIFRALEDTDFVDLIAPLKQSLEVFKKDTKEKNQKKAEAKKRKAEQQEQQQQEPDMDDMNEQEGPDSAFGSDQQPIQMESQLASQPQSIQQPELQQHMQPVDALHASATDRSDYTAEKRQKQSDADAHMTDVQQDTEPGAELFQQPQQATLSAQAEQHVVIPDALPSHQHPQGAPLPQP